MAGETFDGYYEEDNKVEDIKHVSFGIDGESEGEELRDIKNEDGSIPECTNWNGDLTKKGTLESLYPPNKEKSAEELVAIYKAQQEKGT